MASHWENQSLSQKALPMHNISTQHVVFVEMVRL